MTQEKLNTIRLFVLASAVWSAVVFAAPEKKEPVAMAAPEQVKPAPAAMGNDKLVWLDNYEAALKEAKATGKPIFLEFRCAP